MTRRRNTDKLSRLKRRAIEDPTPENIYILRVELLRLGKNLGFVPGDIVEFTFRRDPDDFNIGREVAEPLPFSGVGPHQGEIFSLMGDGARIHPHPSPRPRYEAWAYFWDEFKELKVLQPAEPGKYGNERNWIWLMKRFGVLPI